MSHSSAELAAKPGLEQTLPCGVARNTMVDHLWALIHFVFLFTYKKKSTKSNPHISSVSHAQTAVKHQWGRYKPTEARESNAGVPWPRWPHLVQLQSTAKHGASGTGLSLGISCFYGFTSERYSHGARVSALSTIWKWKGITSPQPRLPWASPQRAPRCSQTHPKCHLILEGIPS